MIGTDVPVGTMLWCFDTIGLPSLVKLTGYRTIGSRTYGLAAVCDSPAVCAPLDEFYLNEKEAFTECEKYLLQALAQNLVDHEVIHARLEACKRVLA